MESGKEEEMFSMNKVAMGFIEIEFAGGPEEVLQAMQGPPPKRQLKDEDKLPRPFVTKLSDEICSVHVDSRIYFYRFSATAYQFIFLHKEMLKHWVRIVQCEGQLVSVCTGTEILLYSIEKRVDRHGTEFKLSLLKSLAMPPEVYILYARFMPGDNPYLLLATAAHFYRVWPSTGAINLLSPSGLSRPCTRVVGMAEAGPGRLVAVVTTTRPIKQQCKQPNDLYVIEYQQRGEQIALVSEFLIDTIKGRSMFDQSKVYFVSPGVLVLSLYEQIVLLKKIFSKYIAIDNIRVRDFHRLSEESGQMAMTDRKRIIFSEAQTIFVYYYAVVDRPEKTCFELQLVDNFKGNDNAKFILYEGISLQSDVQVLFYVNRSSIRHPKVPYQSNKYEKEDEEDKDEKLKLSLFGIAQLDPLAKLRLLLEEQKKGKANSDAQQIFNFINRFKICNLDYYKSRWEVSEKELANVLNDLLEIEDFEYVKKELTEVLKKEPRNFADLIKIEEKVLTRSILNLGSRVSQKSIRRTLKSIMFLKKLSYRKEFEAFRQVDFIEHKKLRSVSMREEVKLLACKGFQKRLFHFMNIFKSLVICNFEQIFRYLVEEKSLSDLREFFDQFIFLIPNTGEAPDRYPECLLWKNEQVAKPLTVAELVEEIRVALAAKRPDKANDPTWLAQLQTQIRKVIASEWFTNHEFKKHCLLQCSSEELAALTQDLQQFGVIDCIFSYLYRNYSDRAGIGVLLRHLKATKHIKQVYFQNLELRINLEEFIRRKEADRELKGPPKDLPDMILLRQAQLVAHLIQLGLQPFLFTDIFAILRKMNAERLFDHLINEFLKSRTVLQKQMLFYLKEFERQGVAFMRSHQNLLAILVDAVFRNTKLDRLADSTNFRVALHQLHMNQVNLRRCEIYARIFQFDSFLQAFRVGQTYLHLEQSCRKEDPSEVIEQICATYARGDELSTSVTIRGQTVDVSVLNNFIHCLYFLSQQTGINISPQTIIRLMIKQFIKAGNFSRTVALGKNEQVYQLFSAEKINQLITSIVLENIDQQCAGLKNVQSKATLLQDLCRLIPDPSFSRKQLAFIDLCREIQEEIEVEVKDIKTALGEGVIGFFNSLKAKKDNLPYVRINSKLEQFQGHTAEGQFDCFMIQHAQQLIGAKRYGEAVEVARFVQDKPKVLAEELNFNMLCSILSEVNIGKNELEEILDGCIANFSAEHNHTLAFLEEIVRKNLLKSRNVSEDLYSAYCHFVKGKTTNSKRAFDFFFRHSEEQAAAEVSNLKKHYLNQHQGIHTAAFFQMLLRYPASVGFYLLTKSDKLGFKLVEGDLNKLVQKGIVNPKCYYNLSSLALYVQGLAYVDPKFFSSWQFFQLRTLRMGLPQIRRDVNILIWRLRETHQKENKEHKQVSLLLQKHYRMFMQLFGLVAIVELGKEDLKNEDAYKKDVDMVNEIKRLREEAIVEQKAMAVEKQAQVKKGEEKEAKKEQADLIKNFKEKHGDGKKCKELEGRIEQIMNTIRSTGTKQTVKKEPSEPEQPRREEGTTREDVVQTLPSFKELSGGRRVEFPMNPVEQAQIHRKATFALEEKLAEVRSKRQNSRKITEAEYKGKKEGSVKGEVKQVEREVDLQARANAVEAIVEVLNSEDEHRAAQLFSGTQVNNEAVWMQLLQRVYETLSRSKNWLRVVQTLRKRSLQPEMQPKLLEVYQNAIKMEGTLFDIRQIICFDLFLLRLNCSKAEYYDFIFKKVRKAIHDNLTPANVYPLSRLMYFCLGYDQKYELRVQFYFVRLSVRRLLANDLPPKEAMKLEQKVQSFLKKLTDQPYPAKLSAFFDELLKDHSQEAVIAIFHKLGIQN